MSEEKPTTSKPNNNQSSSNVVNLFSGNDVNIKAKHQLLFIHPENQGVRMLYCSPLNPDRLVAAPIVAWALRSDGEVVGLTAWLDQLVDCTMIGEEMDVSWEGYYLQSSEEIFYDAPDYIVAQLTTLSRFFDAPESSLQNDNATDNADHSKSSTDDEYITLNQEISDQVGTHALLVDQETNHISLTPVISWGIGIDGQLHGMIADENEAEQYPVIAGDDCLYPAAQNKFFRCYFQRDIVHQINNQNPEALAAVEQIIYSENQ